MSRSGKPTSIQISRAAVLSVIGAETEKGKGGGTSLFNGRCCRMLAPPPACRFMGRAALVYMTYWTLEEAAGETVLSEKRCPMLLRWHWREQSQQYSMQSHVSPQLGRRRFAERASGLVM